MPEWRNWYTHATQNRVSKGMRVQVSPPAQMNKILVILGPTATGKSDLAVKLAKKFNGEVISADSRQVYKGLNIGTGKITKKEMGDIPHYMLDVISPKKTFTIVEWKEQTEKIIKDLLSRGKLPIICGGTGFYIQSIVEGVVLPEVPPNKLLRKNLEKNSLEDLQKILAKLDPRRFSNKSLQIGVTLPNHKLKTKIHDRLLSRIKKGMVKETENLHKNGLSWKRMIELGLEYRFMANYLEKKITKSEFIKKLETEIWHYAKRQMTWFKRDKRIKWFSPRKENKIQKEIKLFLD